MELKVDRVFNPGQYPTYTYKSRSNVEQAFKKWSGERGKILVVHGPSKTGKTVLVQKLAGDLNPIWIEGQGISSIEVLWARIADYLKLFSSVQRSRADQEQFTANVEGQAGFAGSHLRVGTTYSDAGTVGEGLSVDRPLESVVREALSIIDRPLIIDDIHFVSKNVQEDIVKALKPLVFGAGAQGGLGRLVVFISIGNRVMDVITNLTDMRGRMETLPMQYWSQDDLREIAKDGFSQLKLLDVGGQLATKLAEQSYGSPQLMQQLCRELCKGEPNCFEFDQSELSLLNSPNSWEEFFRAQLLSDIGAWIEKLAIGPEVRGSERKLVELKDGRQVHGYQLVLIAVASTGPKLTLTKDEIRAAINRTCSPREEGKAHQVPTQILKNMSLIAATQLKEKVPSLEQLRRRKEEDKFDPYAEADLQPVMEYVEGHVSALYITDPFFAYYLSWGLNDVINKHVAIVENDDGDYWGE